MKDLIGRKIRTGQYIAYALTVGRSANLAVYHVREVGEDSIKAHKVDESYKSSGDILLANGEKWPRKYSVWSWANHGGYRKMTDKEQLKADNKTSTLRMSERVFILDGFTPGLFEGDENGCK